MAVVVQIGYDRGLRPLPGSGGSLAAPIWTDFVRRALHGHPAKVFARPDDVGSLLICAETGQLATPACPARLEYFARGTEPMSICPRHRLVRMLVCRRSHLLPGPYCRHLEITDFHPGEEPAEICHLCHAGLLDWLEKLLRPSRPKEEGPAEPRREPPGSFGPKTHRPPPLTPPP